MAKYDLTGSLEPTFTFGIGGDEFEFRKPTVREMRGLTKEFSKVDTSEDPDEQIKASDEAMGKLYEFIKPVGHDKNLKDVMESQTLDVQLAFNDMIKKELGAS